MMSLHTSDRGNSTDRLQSPLLSREALRRLAWCTFYLDSITDGGRYGSQTVDEQAYRLQLPSDDAFLAGDNTIQPLALVDSSPLDMPAYLIRTAAARRRALHFAFRATHQEGTVEQLSDGLHALKRDLQQVFQDFPQQLGFESEILQLHQNRLPMFVLVHVLRHNLFIICGRAALQVYTRGSDKGHLVEKARWDRIGHALAVADIISRAKQEEVAFDPHIGIQAYVAFESRYPHA